MRRDEPSVACIDLSLLVPGYTIPDACMGAVGVTNRYLIALSDESALLSYRTYESILRLLFTEDRRPLAGVRYYRR